MNCHVTRERKQTGVLFSADTTGVSLCSTVTQSVSAKRECARETLMAYITLHVVSGMNVAVTS